MNTLAALEQYNTLCDEISDYMHEENAHLRASGVDEEMLVTKKRHMIGKLEGALEFLRLSGPVKSAEHSASCEVRKKVLGKILKLLLLSRESEQLLLKNNVRAVPRAEVPQPTPKKVISAYKAQKTEIRMSGTSQAEGSWSVW